MREVRSERSKAKGGENQWGARRREQGMKQLRVCVSCRACVCAVAQEQRRVEGRETPKCFLLSFSTQARTRRQQQTHTQQYQRLLEHTNHCAVSLPLPAAS